MSSAGTYLIFAGLLHRNLFGTLKLGLDPATLGVLSEKTRACFYLWAAGNSTLFSAYSSIEVLIIAILTGTAYCLLCQIPPKTKIPPAFHQAELLPVYMAMIKPWLISPGFPGSRAGKARTARNLAVYLKTW